MSEFEFRNFIDSEQCRAYIILTLCNDFIYVDNYPVQFIFNFVSGFYEVTALWCQWRLPVSQGDNKPRTSINTGVCEMVVVTKSSRM
jgi:hypothetical protein